MRKYPSLKAVKLLNLPEEKNVHLMIQKNPNSDIKLPFIHQKGALDVLLNHKSFHFDANLIFRALLTWLADETLLGERLNEIRFRAKSIAELFVSEVRVRLGLLRLLAKLPIFLASLLDEIFCFLDAVQNVDALPSV